MSALHYGLTPKMKPISPRRSALVAALDIGTSKIACLIARLRPHAPQEVLRRRSHGVEVLGFGHTGARGIKAGTVVDLAEAEQAIRQAVDAAERMASVQLESVVLSVSAGRLVERVCSPPRSTCRALRCRKATSCACSRPAAGIRCSDGRAVLHSLPIGYALDGASGIRDPRGMLGRRFGVDMHVVTDRLAAARNLMLAVERCHLVRRGHGGEPLRRRPFRARRRRSRSRRRADRYGRGHDDDGGVLRRTVRPCRRLCARRAARHHGSRARACTRASPTPSGSRRFYGSVLAGGSDERDMITVPPVGDDEREPPQFASRATLVHVIKPRVEEILEMVRDRLAASPFAAEPRGRAILTGGASQLTGLPELAARILGRPVRIGRPLGIAGLPDAAKGSAFAVATGLLVYPQIGASRTLRTAANAAPHDRDGRLLRTGRTMASRELLMTRTESEPGRRRTGRGPGVDDARAQ